MATKTDSFWSSADNCYSSQCSANYPTVQAMNDNDDPIDYIWASREWGICGSGSGTKDVRLRKCYGHKYEVVEINGTTFPAVNTKGKLRTLMLVLGYNPNLTPTRPPETLTG